MCNVKQQDILKAEMVSENIILHDRDKNYDRLLANYLPCTTDNIDTNYYQY